MFRTARLDECFSLAELKYTYIHTMYNRTSQPVRMDREAVQRHADSITSKLETGSMRVEVMERGGKTVGFVMFGTDPETPGWGYIHETLYLTENTIDMHHPLLAHTLEQLHLMGLDSVHVWVLKNHLRARYLYELYGFRMDGTQQTITIDGEPYSVVRYRYPTV